VHWFEDTRQAAGGVAEEFARTLTRQGRAEEFAPSMFVGYYIYYCMHDSLNGFLFEEEGREGANIDSSPV